MLPRCVRAAPLLHGFARSLCGTPASAALASRFGSHRLPAPSPLPAHCAVAWWMHGVEGNGTVLSSAVAASRPSHRSMAQVASTSGATTGKIRKFYKEVEVKSVDSTSYTVTLDGRRLKTPAGTALCFRNERLAHLVAYEWDSQVEFIDRAGMHLTSLTNTALDNPSTHSREQRVDDLLEYLYTDTIGLWQDTPDAFLELQEKTWTPIIDWFEARFDVTVPTTTEVFAPEMPDATVAATRNYLLAMSEPSDESNREWSLAGVELAVATSKSLVIATALLEGHLSTEEATHAARLETVFQTSRFGEVEWAHTLEQHDTLQRMAAGTLFARLCADI